MHFTIQKTPFVNALSRAAAVAGVRMSMPVLACVRLSVNDTGINLYATDLETGYETYIEHSGDCDLDGEDTTTLIIPAKLLHDVVKAVPVSEVCLEINEPENNVTISGGTATFIIPLIECDEFPAVPEVKGEQFDLTASTLVGILQSVAYAQSKADDKYNLNACSLKIEENIDGELFIIAGATDGHRLALASATLPGDPRQVPADLARGILVATKGVAEICKIKGNAPIVFSIAGNNLCIATDNEKLYLRLIDNQVLDYDRIIPKTCEHKIEIRREATIDAIARVKLITAKDSIGIDFTTTAEYLHLRADRAATGCHAQDKVAGSVLPPVPVRFKVNANYLLQALENLTAPLVEICCAANGMAPLLITMVGTDDPLAVVMPMRPDEVA